MIDAHPEVAVTPSMHWITGYFRKQGIRKPEDLVGLESVTGVLENPRFTRFEIHREDVEKLFHSGEPLTYSGFLAALFDLHRRAKDKPLVGNKTAPYVRHLLELHALWPHAKFVHIIRDGRDVCLSVLNWEKMENTVGRFATWKEDPVSTTALWWKRKVLFGRDGGRRLGPTLYYEIRYESLVSRPEQECRKLCGFLGLPYDDAMLRFHERRDGPVEPSFERAHPVMPVTARLRDWRSQMPRADIERFEAAAGDLLQELGYALASRPGSQPPEVSRVGRRFTREARKRGQKMPGNWRI
jgi:hypothetical protein